MTEDEIYKKAIKKFGENSQIDMMIEECAELQKALLKVRRAKDKSQKENAEHNVREEIADVQIVLNQMKLIFFDGKEYQYQAEKTNKLNRLQYIMM